MDEKLPKRQKETELHRLRREVEAKTKNFNTLISQKVFDYSDSEVIEQLKKLRILHERLAEQAIICAEKVNQENSIETDEKHQ